MCYRVDNRRRSEQTVLVFERRAISKMRIAVTGGREVELTRSEIESLLATLKHLQEGSWAPPVLLHGDCRGVDRQVAKIVEEQLGWEVESWPAEWKRYGRRAGPIRNREMVETAHHLIAFRGGDGTQDCIEAAWELDVEVTEIGRH